jgi:hypothetical protein
VGKTKKIINFFHKQSFLFFISSLLIFTILPLIKIYNFKSSFYDLIFYLNYFKEINNHNYSLLFNFNLQLINFLIANVLKLVPIDKWFVILIIFQSFCLSAPHLIFKKNINIHIIYLLFPTIWFTSLNNFHPEVLIVPIIFLLNRAIFDEKINNLKIYFYLIVIIFIKSSFTILVIGYAFILLKKNKDKKLISFLFISLFIYIYFFLITDDYARYSDLKKIVIDNKNYIYQNFFNIRFILSIFVLVFASGYFLKPNILKILPAIFLLIVYYFLPSDHFKNYYNHYYIALVPFFIFSIEASPVIKRFNMKLSTLILIIHIFLSPSPLSIIFWNDLNWFYDKNTFFNLSKNLNTHKFIRNLNIDNKNIYLENNAVPINLFNHNNKINILKSNSNLNNADFIFMRAKKPFFINDTGCYMSKETCDPYFISEYNKIQNKINKNFKLIFNDNINIKVFKKIE